MIADIAADAAGYDYLSVSFGYTAELWRFWQRCGFTLVRLGTHREAMSIPPASGKASGGR
ncbi:hypothetical protein A7K92_27755 [Klebsiella pneumoniae]|nr:hypothetical protein A7K92_27755 [Klebsiella pneumoniae]